MAAGIPSMLPIIPAPDVVGTVEEAGEGVAALVPADRIGVQPVWTTCARCEFRRSGREHLCNPRRSGARPSTVATRSSCLPTLSTRTGSRTSWGSPMRRPSLPRDSPVSGSGSTGTFGAQIGTHGGTVPAAIQDVSLQISRSWGPHGRAARRCHSAFGWRPPALLIPGPASSTGGTCSLAVRTSPGLRRVAVTTS